MDITATRASQLVLVNGHHLYVEVHGREDLPTVLLLHHGLGSVGAGKEQIASLVGAGFRVIAYDRWGYGKSDDGAGWSAPGFDADLADLDCLWEQFGLMRAALVGHSDGGTIALYFAARHAEWIWGLVTIAAHIYIEPKMEPGIEGVRLAFEQDKRFRNALRHVHGDKYCQAFGNWYAGWHRSENLSWDMRPILSKITCPVLVVQGTDDEHATPGHARDIAEALPDAELWMVPGGRHMLPQENAPIINSRLVEFLNMHSLYT